MAYGLKYTQYISKGGTTLRVNVYCKGWEGATYGMAHITSAALQLIGGQSDVASPIIKTSFSWSLVDAWDRGATQADGTTCVNAAGEKCGRWEEFYTNDATKFRVEVLHGATVIWKGYVTPDSWSEEMIYRGTVTITARDMIGALKDREFDLEDRVAVIDLVRGALEACECPMELSYDIGHFLQNENGESILDHYFAASVFSGKNWYQALEDTLDSLGLVLRYNGASQIVLTSLRYIAEDTLQGTHGIYFANRSGLRELDPALKYVSETFNINFVNVDAADPDPSRFSASGLLMQQVKAFTTNYPATRYDITQYTLQAPLTGGWMGNMAVPRPAQVTDGAPDRSFYFPVDLVDRGEASGYSAANSASYLDPAIRAPFRVKVVQDGGMLKYTPGTGGGTVAPVSSYFEGFAIDSIEVRIRASVGGVARYLGPDGWDTSVQTLTVKADYDIDVPALEGGTDFTVQIWKISTVGAGQEKKDHVEPANDFFFVTALRLQFSPQETSTLPTEFKTTTNYDQANNVVISRAPVIGSANTEFCAAFCENLLARSTSVAADAWNWPGASSFYPLAVMIQAQVLCFHAAAATVFSGTLIDKQADIALPGYAFTHSGRTALPLSGTYNLCGGVAGQAIAREVYSWEEVWGASFAPEYTRREGAGKGSTSATGPSSASVSGGGGASGSAGRSDYFEPDPDFENEIRLKGNYAGLRIPGLRLGEGAEDFDLEVITLANGDRALFSSLPIFSRSDIAGYYTGGTPGGGGSGDFDESAMWAALGGAIGVNEVIDISHIPDLPTTKIYDLENWISGKGFLTQVPVASSSQLGGVKIGSGISIASDGTISAASSEELAPAVAMNASRLDDLEAAFDAPVFGELYAETLRSRSASATELWIGAVRLWYQDGSVRVSGGVLADGDVSGFYNGGSGGGGGSFDEAEMWIALGTTINVKKISSAYLPDITFPVTSVAGATGAVSTTQIADALTAAGYKLTDTVVTSLPWSAITGRPTKVSELTNDVGYITASALTSYATTAYTDAAQGRLARAIGQNTARLDTLEDWLNEPTFSSLFADTLHARSTHTDEVRIGPLRLWYEDGAIRTDGHIFADGDVSGFYTGGTPGGGGSGDFDESQMWAALGTDISAQIIDASHIPSITTAKISNLENWIAAKGYVTSSGVTSVAMTVPTGFSVSGSPITSTGTLAISFASGYSLPTTAKQVNWDAAYTNSHTHANKTVLDGITSSKVSNWDTAYTNNHTHANKTVLDGISSGKVTNWDTAFGWGNHASAGYLKSATAAATYETIANVDAVEARLARAIGQNDARITSLEDWLNEPTFQAVSAGAVSAFTGAFNTLDLSGVALSYTDAGVLQAAGSPLFSAFSSSGATVSATIGGQARSITLASITLNGVATALGGSFRTATITAGTAGQSSATSGVSFSIPYLTMNAYGVVTGYGTHTHSISAAQIVAALGATPVNRATADASGNTITTTYETIANVTAAQQRLARAIGSAYARLDTLEDAYQNGLFSTLRATTVSADNFFTRSHAWIGGNVNAYGDVGGFYGSDARLKDRVRPFSDAADILRRVQPVRFVWKPEAANFNPANTGEDFGVIAQDARAACPLLVREGQYGESDLLGADYGRHLPALLLGGWHDHERRIAALEKENAALKQKLLTAHAK